MTIENSLNTWQAVVLTHRGIVRPTNEGCVAIDRNIFTDNMRQPIELHLTPKFHVLMIADGIGGHVNGALASRTVIEFLTRLPAERLAAPNAVSAAIEVANDRVYDFMETRPETTGMGATLIGVAITDTGFLIFNVGDSRAYLHEPGNLIQLSQDDVPPKHIGASRRRNTHVITQSLGGADVRIPIFPHVSSIPALSAGETILLCSDGLTDMLDDGEICEVLDRCQGLHAGVTELGLLAMRAGGRDNISIIVAQTCLSRSSLP
jgi:serine/threonine protein phosphatase PrpC